MSTIDDRDYSGWLGIGIVLAAGGALRFWNLTAGLPYRIGVDEPIVAEHALAIMKSGNFNPHFFDYPGLYIYFQVMVGCVRFLAGASQGLWRSLDQFYPDHLFLWMRAINAAIGTLTIWLVYRAGLRWGRWVALLAALLIAVWPNHVRESHFALTDVPLTFFTTLALVLSLRARESGTLKAFLLAGMSVGLAAATKYTGGVALVMPLIAAAAIRPARTAALRALAATLAAAGTFLAGAPYTVLDLPGFLNTFAVLASAYRPRPLIEGAQIYLGHLIVAAGWFGIFVASAGVTWAVVRALRDRSRESLANWAILVVFPLVFFDVIATKNLIFGRYLLPFLPFVCLLTAIVIVDAVTWVLRWRQPALFRYSVAGVLLASAVFRPAVGAFMWSFQYGRPTTQDAAYRLIRQIVPEGAAVVFEVPEFRLPLPTYRGMPAYHLTTRSPEEYVSAGVTFFVASADALEPVLSQPDPRAPNFEAYRRLLNDPHQCLPAVTPTAAILGPPIRICRLQTP